MHWLNIDLAPVLNQIMKVVIMVIAGFIAKYGKDYLLSLLKNKLAMNAVKFVEQKYGKALEKKGKEKFDAAAKWMSDRLARIHIKFTPEEIEGYIESAVHELTIQVKKELSQTVINNQAK